MCLIKRVWGKMFQARGAGSEMAVRVKSYIQCPPGCGKRAGRRGLISVVQPGRRAGRSIPVGGVDARAAPTAGQRASRPRGRTALVECPPNKKETLPERRKDMGISGPQRSREERLWRRMGWATTRAVKRNDPEKCLLEFHGEPTGDFQTVEGGRGFGHSEAKKGGMERK